MPAIDGPKFNSNRVQRAYRINNVENSRLEGKLHLLEKEKIHKIRVTNQDIRLISITLDYINASSGYSPEGLSPDSVAVEEERVNSSVPCFLYGERVVSRKKRRFQQRPFSATDRSNSRRSLTDVTDRSSVSRASIASRPQSSPTKSRTFVTSIRGSDDDDSVFPSENSSFASNDDSSCEYLFPNETSDVTKKLLRAKAAAEKGINPRRGSLHQKEFNRVRSHSVFNMNNLMRQLPGANNGTDRSTNNNPGSRRTSTILTKNSGLMDILNQRRPTLTANAWSKQLNNTKSSPFVPRTISAQRQHVLDMKRDINDDRREQINHKVNNFMAK